LSRAPPDRRPSAWIPPSTRPDRCSTQLLGLPRRHASFSATRQDLDRTTRSKGERNGSRSANLTRAPPAPPIAWLTTVKATHSVQYATFGTTGASCLPLRYSSRLGSSDTVDRGAEQVERRQFVEGAARPPSERLDTTFNANRQVQYATFGTTEASCLLLSYSSRLGSGTGGGPPVYRGRCEPTQRLAHHLQRHPIGTVRNFWDYRGATPPSKVLLKTAIERHGQKASGTGRGPPIFRRRREPSQRLAHHLQRDPLSAARHFSNYRGSLPPSRVLLKNGIERHGRKASGTGRGSQFYRRRRRQHRKLSAHHLQRDALGAARNFRDYRGLVPPSKVLAKIGIERHGPKASGTGRGPPVYRGHGQHRRVLGSTPTTRPARCSTQFLELPRIDASF
jgi:hypothetical protein